MKEVLYLYGFDLDQTSKSKKFLKILQNQAQLKVQISLVFFHNAVIGINKNTLTPEFITELLKLPIKIYAIKPDLIARGLELDNNFESVQLIDYDKLVDLIVEIPITASWL